MATDSKQKFERVKISRSFTFKAFQVDSSKTTREELKSVYGSQHTGEFKYKSECHYYCEKEILDMLRGDMTDTNIYAIYKVCTLEDNDVADTLVELIYVNDGKIAID